MTGRARAEAKATIGARTDAVYEVIADYRTHHPNIMPPSLFSRIEVESGGTGAGTTFHITLHLAGTKKRMRMRVAEPDPGRVLTETNLDTGIVTAFEVTPANGDGATLARISSDWETAPGIRGLFDRVATPPLMRWIFGKQLRQLARYMTSGRAPT
jgi:Polyketide cyclase / dehydrase and lipid transport